MHHGVGDRHELSQHASGRDDDMSRHGAAVNLVVQSWERACAPKGTWEKHRAVPWRNWMSRSAITLRPCKIPTSGMQENLGYMLSEDERSVPWSRRQHGKIMEGREQEVKVRSRAVFVAARIRV